MPAATSGAVSGAACVIRARGLWMDGPRGPVFGPVDLDVPAGSLTLVAGPAGSGRTSMLLTVAGRMAGARGHLEVAGLPIPRRRSAVQHTVTLATFRGVNDLDGALTVEEHVLERLALVSPGWRLLLPSAAEVAPVLAAVTDLEGPAAGPARELAPGLAAGLAAGLAPDRLVRDLTPLDRFRLGLALSLVSPPTRRPHVLVVDDVDALRDPASVETGWRLLLALTEPSDRYPEGLTVLASCTTADAVPADVRSDPRTQVHLLSRPQEPSR